MGDLKIGVIVSLKGDLKSLKVISAKDSNNRYELELSDGDKKYKILCPIEALNISAQANDNIQIPTDDTGGMPADETGRVLE